MSNLANKKFRQFFFYHFVSFLIIIFCWNFPIKKGAGITDILRTRRCCGAGGKIAQLQNTYTQITRTRTHRHKMGREGWVGGIKEEEAYLKNTEDKKKQLPSFNKKTDEET